MAAVNDPVSLKAYSAIIAITITLVASVIGFVQYVDSAVNAHAQIEYHPKVLGLIESQISSRNAPMQSQLNRIEDKLDNLILKSQ